MFDQVKNFMIGLFVIAAGAIILFILLFIHPMVGDEGSRLHVRFSNIDKVNIGTRVTFAGRPVGEVTDIKEIFEEPDPRLAHEGQVYVYELTLAVDSSVKVYNSDEISLRTSGLLGEKSVNITPRPPVKGQVLRLVNDEVIYATETGTVEDTFKDLKELSDKVDKAVESISSALDDLRKTKMIDHIAATFKNLEDITGALNKPKEWSDIVDNVNTITENIVASWETVDEVLKNLADTTENTRDITADGKVIVAKVKDGEGTVGKLFMSDDLYLRVTSLLSKGETVMNDINHYGILFHLDKNWQRLRARRLNLLQQLCTPQQFRNYFNDEMDQISTSLSRVYMVLNKNGNCTMGPHLVRDYEFVKVFSELMRRVVDVEDSLKLYNTQLQDTRVKETELLDCCY